MKRSLRFLAVAVISLSSSSIAAQPKLPNFLPDYYAPAFQVDGVDLDFITNSTTNGIEQWQYGSTNESIWLSVDWIKCDSSQAEIIFNNLVGYLDKMAGEHGGRFHVIEQYDIYATITEEEGDRHTLAYRLANGVLLWTYALPVDAVFPAGQFDTVKFSVNRQRYVDACREGNVALGRWGDEFYDYASVFLLSVQKAEAVKVLGRLIATSPYQYEAHLDYMRNTEDSRAATNSAEIVADNAEDEAWVRQAESFLGRDAPSLESIPVLEPGEKGLQLVLIPLPPCNIRLLEEAVGVYQEMTDIPVKIRRLKEEWKWSAPERIGGQRTMERMLVSAKGEQIDFTGWTKDRYFDELRTASTDKGAYYEYRAEEMIDEIGSGSGQYRVDRYVNKLCRMLEGYCSTDKRTMYIGVTESNLYSDNNNYVFSQGRIGGKSRASVLSYYMMQAKVLGEDYGFRSRLAERLAKEMVPASLKQLNIPRSTDPRCPYSYSSGVSRLDEKTLNLSKPVEDALQKFREMP